MVVTGAYIATVGGHIDVRFAFLVKFKTSEAAGLAALEKGVHEGVDLVLPVIAPDFVRGSAVLIILDTLVIVDVRS